MITNNKYKRIINTIKNPFRIIFFIVIFFLFNNLWFGIWKYELKLNRNLKFEMGGLVILLIKITIT